MPKRGTAWIYLGLLLLSAALFLSAANLRTSHHAGEASRDVIAQLSRTLPTQNAAETEPSEIPEELPATEREMPEKITDGRAYIGVLRIPSLELELPVLSRWDSDGLKIAPCRYSGSLYRNDLILCAHNYASHFGRLSNLQIGDTAVFTDMEENMVMFQMVEQETLSPTDMEGMEQGDWDLTLFTCTVGGQARVTVRFVRAEPGSES